MRSFSLNEVRESLAALGIRRGDLVLMHASLLTLGSLQDCDVKQSPAAIVECLVDYLGPQGTLATPAFNFGFCRGTEFNREDTTALSMGVLAETVRTRPGSCRSRHPTQSIAATGRLATQLCDDDGELAFGRDSAFARLVEHGAGVLLFGVNFQAASLIHGAEETVGVPYRYWKEFHGDYVDAGIRRQHKCRMYVRDLALDPQLSMKPLEIEMAQQQMLRKSALGRGQLSACTARDLVTTGEFLLRRNPGALVAATKASVAISQR